MINPILVTGAAGMLGSAVMRAATMLGIQVVGLTRRDCDIGDRIQVAEVLGRYQDPVVINCAGIVRERTDVDPVMAAWVNSVGPQILAFNADRVVQVSTDCVFDGTITEGAYTEESPPCPPDQYGRSKLFGELLEAPHLTVRVSFIGMGQRGLIHWLLSQPEGAEVPGFTNWLWNGWTASGVAPVLIRLAVLRPIKGLVHLPGPDIMTKASLLKQVARRLRPDLSIVESEAPVARRMVLEGKALDCEELWINWGTMLEELSEEYREFRQNALRWEVAQASLEAGTDYQELGPAQDDDPL